MSLGMHAVCENGEGLGDGRGRKGGEGGLVKGRGERRVVMFCVNPLVPKQLLYIVENEIDVESSIDVKSRMIAKLTRSEFESAIDRKCKLLRTRTKLQRGGGGGGGSTRRFMYVTKFFQIHPLLSMYLFFPHLKPREAQ